LYGPGFQNVESRDVKTIEKWRRRRKCVIIRHGSGADSGPVVFYGF
jgi:hypothetical protein